LSIKLLSALYEHGVGVVCLAVQQVDTMAAGEAAPNLKSFLKVHPQFYAIEMGNHEAVRVQLLLVVDLLATVSDEVEKCYLGRPT